MKKMCRVLSMLIILMLLVGAASAEGLWFYQQESANKANGRVMQYLYDMACMWGEEWMEVDLAEALPVYAYPAEDAWRGAIFDGAGGVQICDTEDFSDESIDSLIIRKDTASVQYHVYENALGEKRYPGCPYVLEIESENHFRRYGMRLEADEAHDEILSLIIAEGGGGGYERAIEIEIVRE